MKAPGDSMNRLLLFMVLWLTVLKLTETKDNCSTEKKCKDIRSSNEVNTGAILVTKNTVNKYEIAYICHEDGTYTARLKCNSPVYEVNGSSTLQCENHTWNPEPPTNCVPKPRIVTKSEKWKFIAGGVGGGAGVIVAVVVVTVILLRRRARLNKIKTEEEIALHNLYTNPQRHGNKHTFKVWTLQRSAKKVIVAENLTQLKSKAESIFGYSEVQIVLEEDGTDIDTDESLAACSDRVLLALNHGEFWIAYSTGHEHPEEGRLTYDVCSYDRNSRKLVLALNLKDLKYQCSASFRYFVDRFCLEIDGTVIDDDDALVFLSTQTLMAMGKDHIWTAAGQGAGPPVIRNSFSDENMRNQKLSEKSNRKMYKVWSADHTQRKVVFADSLVDFHLQSARMLGLETPIKVFVAETDEEVVDETSLERNKDRVLVIRKPRTDTQSEPLYHIADGDSSMARMEARLDPPAPFARLDPPSTSARRLSQLSVLQQHQDRPPGGVNIPGYRLMDTSHAHLRHVDNEYAPFPTSDHYHTLPPQHRHSDDLSRALPYQDLTPHHHASRKLRHPPSGEQRAGMGFRRQRRGSVDNGELTRHQLSNKPYIVTGDAPQSRNSDVLF